MDSKLIEIIESRPSAVRNSFLIGIIRILALIIGLSVFIVGASILVNNALHLNFFSRFDIIKKVDHSVMNIIGGSAFIVGLLLLFIARLCSMLLRRNLFLLRLDTWRYEWEQSEKKSSSE